MVPLPVNFDLLPHLKAASARLVSPVGAGTGYLVEPRKVATCAHVVRDLPAGTKVQARFGDRNDAPAVVARVAAVDPAADSALLELDAPVANGSPLKVWQELPSRADWTAYGFPAFANPLGVVLTGMLTDPNAQVPGNMRGMALFSQMLGSHPPASVGGLSGSPVFIDGCVVGHISSVLGSEGAMQQPHLGYAYAAPVAGVLRLLGHSVAAPKPAGPPTSEDQIIVLSRAFNALQSAASGDDVRRTLSNTAAPTPELLLCAAEILIGLALPSEALKVLQGLSDGRAKELTALALSLEGDHAGALAITSTLALSAESKGIEGGILKRRWLATRNQAHLRRAFQTYYEAYAVLRDHYPGINAAACALYLDRRDQAEQIASDIAGQLSKKKGRNGWEEGSLAEAYLLTGKLEDARKQYGVAVDAQNGRARDIAVMRTQARRNAKYLGLDARDAKALADAFPPARRVAAFTGHRVGPNLPSNRIAFVWERILDSLEEQEIQFGYCSAASGSDLLFIEALLERGAEVQVFLPFPAQHFRLTSVGPDPAWLVRFDNVLARVGSHRVVELSSESPQDDDPLPYVRCNDAIQEAARTKARILGEPPVLIAVIAPGAEASPAAPGGTAHAVSAWLNRGERDVVRIYPSE